jgi:hypothetical protein
MSEDILVTINHVRAVRHNGQQLCARGMRMWCARVGIDYGKALREGGVRASELEKIDDHFARLVLETAREMNKAAQ